MPLPNIPADISKLSRSGLKEVLPGASLCISSIICICNPLIETLTQNVKNVSVVLASNPHPHQNIVGA
jgi:hypothetical protein